VPKDNVRSATARTRFEEDEKTTGFDGRSRSTVQLRTATKQTCMWKTGTRQRDLTRYVAALRHESLSHSSAKRKKKLFDEEKENQQRSKEDKM